MRILPEVLKSLVKKPFTRKYPKIPAETPEGFRGKHFFDRPACIGCQLCVRACPSKAITFLPAEKKVEFDLMKCVFCGLCEDVCPVKCIKLTKEIPLSQQNKKLLIK